MWGEEVGESEDALPTHHRVHTRLLQTALHVLIRTHPPIGDDGDAHSGLDGANGLPVRCPYAVLDHLLRPPVHGQHGATGRLERAGEVDGVGEGRKEADLTGDRDGEVVVKCGNDGLEERHLGEKKSAVMPAASDALGAAEVEVHGVDLPLDVAGGLEEGEGVVATELSDERTVGG